MKIEMDYIKAHIARAGNSHDCIGIRSVVIEETTGFMNDFSNFYDLLLKKTKCARICEH
ncbi:hypothetical protein D3C74_340990 [compost metagenome]